MSVAKKSVLLIFLILFIDQAVKIYIKLHFNYGELINVFSWFKIHFIENRGMAFGMEIFSKLFLTLFRIIAVGLLAYYIHFLIKKQVRPGYILVVSMVLAGAAGNIIDSVFYGLIFDKGMLIDNFGYEGIASFSKDGYTSIFYGNVVDMLYFPIIQIQKLPDWIPFIGSKPFTFFSPIFNIADSAISVAVGIILIFYRKELNDSLESKKEKNVQIPE